jgi:hypothetical protein
MLELTQVSGLYGGEIYLSGKIYVSFPSANTSNLLSETFGGIQKAKKRGSTSAIMNRTTPNTFSPSQSRNLASVKNQRLTNALSSTKPYSQPAHQIMISCTLISTDGSIVHPFDILNVF